MSIVMFWLGTGIVKSHWREKKIMMVPNTVAIVDDDASLKVIGGESSIHVSST